MDPASLIPEAAAIPMQPWLLQVLLVLTFALHLLLMNIVVGGSVVALVEELRNRKQTAGTPVGRELSTKMTMTLALAVNMGVAPLLFLQVLYGQFLYTSSTLMAWFWLGLLGVLIVAYYGLYLYNFRYNHLGRRRPLLLGACAALLLCVAFLFSNNMTLMLKPESWLRYFDAPGGALLHLAEPTLLPRYLHMVVSALAVGGLFLAVAANFKRKREKMTPQDAERRVNLGLRWFTHATLLQLVVGTWFLLALPRPVMLLFMGKGAPHTALFAASLVLLVLSLYFGFRRNIRATVWTLVALVLVMTVMRALVRAAYLAPYFSMEDLAVAPQYGPFALFMISLLLGLAVIAWVLKLALAAGARATGHNGQEG